MFEFREGYLRFAIRFSAAVILAAGILALPAMAAGEAPLGVVLVAGNAHLGTVSAAMGADVYPGDILATDPGGTLRVKAGASQFYLAAASTAALSQQNHLVRVNLITGTAGFSLAETGRFEVETPVGIVRAASGQRAFGEVSIAGPHKILVAAYHGDLVVDGNGQERTIKEGEAYNVSFVPDTTSSSASAEKSDSPTPALGPGKTGHIIFDAVIISAAGVAAYYIWQESTESDDRIHPQ